MARLCLLLVATTAAFDCFVDKAFNDLKITVQKDVPYGSAYNNATKKEQTLLLDAYFPPASDNRSTRPAAVLVHGGSFETGSKTSDDEPELAKQLVSRGYVAVSINYRLTGNYYGLTSTQPALDATEDARAATRYVRKMAKQWRIDTDRILMAGDSAGAITSLYDGYVKAGQAEGESGNPDFSSKISAAVSVSGELKIEAFCKSIDKHTLKPSGCAVEAPIDYTDNVTGKDQPPLLMVHGTADNIVPYLNGKAVADQATKVGLLNKLITIPNAQHVPFNQLFKDSDVDGPYIQQFMKFLQKAMDLEHAQCPTPEI